MNGTIDVHVHLCFSDSGQKRDAEKRGCSTNAPPAHSVVATVAHGVVALGAPGGKPATSDWAERAGVVGAADAPVESARNGTTDTISRSAANNAFTRPARTVESSRE